MKIISLRGFMLEECRIYKWLPSFLMNFLSDLLSSISLSQSYALAKPEHRAVLKHGWFFRVTSFLWLFAHGAHLSSPTFPIIASPERHSSHVTSTRVVSISLWWEVMSFLCFLDVDFFFFFFKKSHFQCSGRWITMLIDYHVDG